MVENNVHKIEVSKSKLKRTQGKKEFVTYVHK